MNFWQSDEPYYMHFGDCITHMATMPAACVDHAVFSVPFPALFSYTSEACDLGNSEELRHEAKCHFGFFYKQLARVMKPGRVVIVHCMQIPRFKRSGGRGLHDFRGTNIRIGERAGLIYEYDWLVRKAPQAQAIRTKSHNLQFAGLERDRANARGALCDYLIKFVADGDNMVPISDTRTTADDSGDFDDLEVEALHPRQVSRNDWIDWAEGAWMDIKETDTLNKKNGFCGHTEAGGEDDVKHICPLQLGIIDRSVRLYSNPGEVVFSPFAGIGSEGVISVKLGRRFYGCELKREYFDAALFNLDVAVRQRAESQRSLFDAIETSEAVAAESAEAI